MDNNFNDALIDCVKACGGSKQVGAMLWPDKAPDSAQRLLLDCLKENRPEKLSPDQALFIMRTAKTKGCHIGVEFICESLGYTKPSPLDPKDEKAELQRQFVEASKTMAAMLSRIEALQS